MINYLLILISDILLAAQFLMQKQYQNKAGTSVTAGLIYNGLVGLVSGIIFWFAGGCRLHFSLFSILMAFGMSALVTIYTLLGFRILKSGSIAYYTLFLMTGGMCVPYVWGILVLNEPLTLMHSLGLLLIVAAVILSNTGSKRLTLPLVLLCVAIFFTNGFVSVISKMHQIDTVHSPVSSENFVCLTGITKFIFCCIILLVNKLRKAPEAEHLQVPVKKVLPLIAAVALVMGVSYMLQLIGAKDLEASVLYPLITGGSIIFSALAGLIVFREKPSKMQWIGIVLCCAGTCMLL